MTTINTYKPCKRLRMEYKKSDQNNRNRDRFFKNRSCSCQQPVPNSISNTYRVYIIIQNFVTNINLSAWSNNDLFFQLESKSVLAALMSFLMNKQNGKQVVSLKSWCTQTLTIYRNYLWWSCWFFHQSQTTHKLSWRSNW